MITPAPPRSRYGNRVTALRWTRMLENLGHRVKLSQIYEGQPCDLMIALHARRSAPAVERFRRECPGKPLVVVLTGTDLYRDIHHAPEAQATLETADVLVTLQDEGQKELKSHLQNKVRVILQSAPPLPRKAHPPKRFFQVCVVGHLREEKDPFRTPQALRFLPASLPIRVLHAGGAMDQQMEKLAKAEMAQDDRYRWLGELPRWRVRRLMAESHAMVLSSRMEGGANVISEAVAGGLPVLASQIPGSVGLLGADYPGFFPSEDTQALADMLLRLQQEPVFLASLKTHLQKLQPLFTPQKEQAAWKKLIESL